MLKKYRSTALAVSVITAMACLKYALFQGGELRPVSLDPQRAAVKQDAGAELVYADDSFQLYFFPTENGPAPLAYVKRLGVWVQDYPGNRGVSPAYTVNGTVYYFGLPESLEGAGLAVLVSPDGRWMDGLPLSVEGETRFLFRLPAGEDACYRFAPVVGNAPLPQEEDPFAVGTILVEAQKDGAFAHSLELPLSELSQAHPELESLLRQAYASADRESPVENGRTYPGSVLEMDFCNLHLTAKLGDYLKIEEGSLPLTFTHSVYLNFELEGYHKATMSLSETDLRNKTIEESLRSKPEVYPFSLSPGLTAQARTILEEYPARQESGSDPSPTS